MTDDLVSAIAQLITALAVILNFVFSRWKAARDFDLARGQNQALEDLRARGGVETLAPPARRRRRRSLGILPRAPTPLPFFPVPAAQAVPEPIEAETSTTSTDRNQGG